MNKFTFKHCLLCYKILGNKKYYCKLKELFPNACYDGNCNIDVRQCSHRVKRYPKAYSKLKLCNDCVNNGVINFNIDCNFCENNEYKYFKLKQ